jgi:hypothetical protein
MIASTTFVRAVEVDYSTQIKPILKARCYACHGALKQEAGLRLDTGIAIRQGGENGSILSTDSPDESALMDRVTSTDDDFRMPPEGQPLAAQEIALVRKWISAGAPSPADEAAENDLGKHWAFQIPRRAQLPSISNPAWPRNAIDFFLHAEYDRQALKPASDAAPARVLRRLYLDLIGLPPTFEQLQAFLNDPSETAYQQTVDQLLDSPHYGERWGRHWMDVWRYSDWYGRRQQNDVRNSAPQIWRWRDWVVDSLNADKSYARMVQEMIAADEIAATDDSAWPATGYLIRNYYSLNPNEWMRHNVEYTGKAFLGLTFNCAHCHDHKYDPISHDDYFRLRAFFEPIGIRQDRVLGQAEPPEFQPYVYSGSRKIVREGMVRIFDERPDATTWFYTDGDERNKVKERGSIPPGVPSFLGLLLPDITPVDLPMAGWYPGSRPKIQRAILDELEAAVRTAEQAHQQAHTESVDSTIQQAQLVESQRLFDDALQKAIEAGESGAVAGKQSLYLDAVQGRRIIQNALSGLTEVPDGTTISFELRILQDNHVNFQLARDTTKGHTALYVGFVEGNIKAYASGGFQEFTAGTYTFDEGQNHFEVTLVIHPSEDNARLTVLLHGTENYLVQDQLIALNGWNSAVHPHQPFTFDCRSGTQALVDEVTVVAGKQTLSWGFEEPHFKAGEDVKGIHGWQVHPQSRGPATSYVSMIAGCESARKPYEALQRAKAALRAVSLPRTAADLRLAASRLKLAGTIATVAADNAIRNRAPPTVIERTAKVAFVKQRTADIAEAKWRILATELDLQRARALPDGDKEKKKRIATLGKTLAAAREDLKTAVDLQASTPESTAYTKLSPTTARQSTGRRTALAYWITDPRNPLTPRVAINHLWMRHFHAPLVESVYDFGRNGKSPIHPTLLDWLAVELLEHEWSMKHIHRLMVTSRAYRMRSSDDGTDENLAKDKDNRQLWRMNQGRMESEVIRDSVLFIAGNLDRTVGGPVLPNTQALTTNRRSLYYEVYPENGGSDALADVFDAPDPTECFRRTSTIVPQQALALSNSKIIHLASGQAAKRISQRVGKGDELFIAAAFMTVLSRPPVQREVAATTRFLAKQRKLVEDEQMVRESLIRVLFNHNDFVTIR